jgi:hypothetical protein
VLLNLIKNPINQMTALGIISNLIFKHQVSVVIAGLLQTFAKSFTATALFLLGLNMTGRFSQFRNLRRLILPAVLVSTKLIVFPMVCRFVLEHGMSGSAQDIADHSSFGFLFGTIPTAPMPFIYALEYNVQPDLIASSLVICTMLSCPMMFLSANMVRTINAVVDNYHAELSQFLSLISTISLPCLFWLLCMFLVTKQWRLVTHRCTLFIIISNLFMCVGGYLMHFVSKDKSTALFHIQYLLMVSGLFSARIWTCVLAITVSALQCKSLCFVLKILNRLTIGAVFFTVALVGLVIAMPDYPNVHSLDPSFELGQLQTSIIMCILSLGLFITISGVVLQQRYSYRPQDDEEQLIASPSIAIEAPASEDETGGHAVSQEHSSAGINHDYDMTMPSPDILDVEDLVPEGFDDFCHSQSNICTKKQRKECIRSIQQYRTDAEPVIEDIHSIASNEFYEKHQVFTHLLFLLYSCLSMFVGLEVAVAKIVVEHPTAILIEMEYLDILLNNGTGVVLFLLFGIEIEPISRFFRQMFKQNASSNDDQLQVTLICDQFLEQHLNQCKKDLNFTISAQNDQIAYVFQLNDLIRWIQHKKLATDSVTAKKMVDDLISGKVIECVPVSNSYHANSPLYKFTI